MHKGEITVLVLESDDPKSEDTFEVIKTYVKTDLAYKNYVGTVVEGDTSYHVMHRKN